MSSSMTDNWRIIIIDDNEGIHEDFRKILGADTQSAEIDDDEAFLFGTAAESAAGDRKTYEMDSAFQGRDGAQKVRIAVQEGRPYALAFVDMRMPPGWDGVETIEHLWQIDPCLQVVICTAYSDYSWQEMVDRLGQSDRLLILKKPFDVVEVAQLTMALTEKWSMQQRLTQRMDELEHEVDAQNESLNDAMEKLVESHKFLHCAMDSLSPQMTILDSQGRIEQTNHRWVRSEPGNPIAGSPLSVGTDYVAACEAGSDVVPFGRELASALRDVLSGTADQFCGEYQCHFENTDSRFYTVRVTRFEIDGLYRAVVAHEDTTEYRMMQSQLTQAQKLESVGSLAAGVAHEINTPIQYIGDNTRFLQDSFSDLTSLLELTSELLEVAKQNESQKELVGRVEKATADADLEYLLEEVPPAFDQSLQGIARVSKIVRAMKEFSHPGSEDKQNVDLNYAIESTLTVASNEWKYVAEVATDFDKSLPVVPCLPCEINQVILNIIVNAAHAIADVVGDASDGKGRIDVRTRRDGDFAEIRISDSGTGIPPEVQPRIFNPFFTTKDVGRGTGQGLSLAWSTITEQHNGSLTFETQMGKGTTFVIRLPLQESLTGELPAT